MADRSEKEIMEKWRDTGGGTPVVSVRVLAYNHGPFISSAIDGFLSQITNFPFEVIIHDDVSTDNTVEIIKRYAVDYPHIIKPIYETENQYMKMDGSINRIFEKQAEGKYVAFCEGDDYWCDPYKLQKQVDYMEQNPSCAAYLHNGYVYNVKTGDKWLITEKMETQVLSEREILREERVHPPTASMLFNREMFSRIPDFFKELPAGDRPFRMFMMLQGYVYFSKEPMCVYRLNVPGAFSERTVNNQKFNEFVLNSMVNFFDQYNDYTDHRFEEDIKYIKSRELHTYYAKSGKKFKAMTTYYWRVSKTLPQKTIYIASVILPQGIKNLLKKAVSR